MIIGLPREIKDNEYRVAVTPGGVRHLVENGHTVLVEHNAGVGSGFGNAEYEWVGGRLVPRAEDAWSADLVVKVKGMGPKTAALVWELLRG